MLSVSGEDKYNCPRSEPPMQSSLLDELNLRIELRRLFLRRRIDFDLCNIGRGGCDDPTTDEEEDDEVVIGGGGSLSLSIFSAIFHIVCLCLLSRLPLPFWADIAACRAENGEEGESLVIKE